jgi:hypothetical protein
MSSTTTLSTVLTLLHSQNSPPVVAQTPQPPTPSLPNPRFQNLRFSLHLQHSTRTMTNVMIPTMPRMWVAL